MCEKDGNELLFRPLIQEDIQAERHEERHEEMQGQEIQIPQQMQQEQEPAVPEAQQAQKGRAGKQNPTPEQVAAQIEREKEKRRRKAEDKDRKKVRKDQARHGLYKAVGSFVKVGRRLFGRDAEARHTVEDTPYSVEFAEARDRFDALWMDAQINGTEEEFVEKYGQYMQMLNEQDVVVEMPFENIERTNVVGGTKPNAVHYTQDGKKWLMKEGLSCIGCGDPSAPIVTEIGYQVQKLIHPDTAIEAFRAKKAGKGTVSYQRMVSHVVSKDAGPNYVDLFQFSRTPESMTESELAHVQELAPQILREHTTDWLLCNFDTKGENFILSKEDEMRERLYGIDKEAGLRAILDPGAQKMSKDYQWFDQDTVYNQLFRKFADGSMDFDLAVVEEQIQRVETVDDETYMALFTDYIHLQQRERPDQVEEIKKNILRRKQNLRYEYREFLGNLVKERQHTRPEEAEALRDRYLGGEEDGIFIFQSDTPETIHREQQRQRDQQMENKEEMERKVRKAERWDKIKHTGRHFIYDFSKAVVMGLKKMKSTRGMVEEKTSPATHVEMVRDEEIFLGGTKPMSQYYGDDGSQWLAKQAVNCMGYYKIEGALLTEAGANLQMAVHPETAVEAFQGRTRRHGDVSFQRRLQNVEGRKHVGGKLDLFHFSKHPELATAEDIKSVEALGSQILREHTTDWLLCNFDTKGENFVITRTEMTDMERHAFTQAELANIEQDNLTPQEQLKRIALIPAKVAERERVLHGIDKEAAFNNILNPEAQHMSRMYKPHANNTLYNVVFSMYANAEMDLDLYAVLPQIQNIKNMGEAEYFALFDKYIEHLEIKKPEQVEEIKAAILRRKEELEQDYGDFFTELVNERCKKLHPDEAQQLRQHYFGGTDRFQWPH